MVAGESKSKVQAGLNGVGARTKRDHWVPGLPRHRWYTYCTPTNGTEVAPSQGLGCQSCPLCGKYGHNYRSCLLEVFLCFFNVFLRSFLRAFLQVFLRAFF